MAKHKQTTTQRIINSGPMQFLMPFPEEGRLLRVTISGSGLVAAVADEVGKANDALPFTYALRSLRVDPVDNPTHPFRPYLPGKAGVENAPRKARSHALQRMYAVAGPILSDLRDLPHGQADGLLSGVPDCPVSAKAG